MYDLQIRNTGTRVQRDTRIHECMAAGNATRCCSRCVYAAKREREREREREVGERSTSWINGLADPKRRIMDERLPVTGAPATFPVPRLTWSADCWLPV